MKFNSDIDIDLGDRDKLLSLISHTKASIRKNEIKKHNTGVYVTDIPYDPVNDMSSLHYEDAENRGYIKLDLLNVHVYNQVRDEKHLVELMKEPNWDKLKDKQFVEQLIHLGNHYNTLCKMPEPVNSIPRLAMFLAVIRPGKKHLIGLPWSEVSKTVWEKDEGTYSFKKSHSLAYAHLVVVHMNLLVENGN
jgi:hypothetical protein